MHRQMNSIIGRGSEILAAILLIASLAIGNGCKSKTNAFAPPPPAEVTVAQPIQKDVTQYLEYTGTTEPYETVDLRARVSGFLEQVNFKPGSKVKKGELLFVIDKRPYQAAVAKAEAQIASDQAAYKAAESDARIAEELFAQRAGSEIDKITKAGKRDSAQAAVEASKAVLENAKLDLEFCEVHAPIDGRITKNDVDVGNLIGPSGGSAGGTSGAGSGGGGPTLLATLVSSKPLYVSIDASESDLLAVRRSRIARDPTLEPGQIAPGEWRPVDLALADESEFRIHGHIDYVDPALNPQTGTIRVRARFENGDEFLIPGLFVRVRILLGTQGATLAPDIALLSDQGGRYALVVNDKNIVEIRRVQVGALDGSGGMRVVTEGLSVSDRIIVNGLQRARPGATVKPTVQEIKPTTSPAATTQAAGH